MNLIPSLHPWLAIAGIHRKVLHFPSLAETVQVFSWVSLFIGCIAFIAFLSARTVEYSICFIPEDWISDPELPFYKGKGGMRHHFFRIDSKKSLPWKFGIFYIVLGCISIFWIFGMPYVLLIIAELEMIILIQLLIIIGFLFFTKVAFTKVVYFLAPIEELWVREYLQSLKNGR